MNSISLSFGAFPEEKAGGSGSLRLRSPEEKPMKDVSRTDFSESVEEKLPKLSCASCPIQKNTERETKAQFSAVPVERKSGTLFFTHGNKDCPLPNLNLVLLRGPPECHRRIPLYVPSSSSSAPMLPLNAMADSRHSGLVVGRSTTCDVVLDPWLVFASSRHALLSSQPLSPSVMTSGATGTVDTIVEKEKILPTNRIGKSERIEKCEKGEDETFWLTDLGSTNGTFVNKERLPAMVPHALHHGDTIIFGGMQDVVELLDSTAMQRSELVVWRVETPAGAEDERLLFSSVEDDVRVGSVILDSVVEEEKIPEQNEEDGLYEPTTLPIRPCEYDLDRYASFLLEEAIDSTHTSWCERKKGDTIPKALHLKSSTEEGPPHEGDHGVVRNEMGAPFPFRPPSPIVGETPSEEPPKVDRASAEVDEALSSARTASIHGSPLSTHDGGEGIRTYPSRPASVHFASHASQEGSPFLSQGRCTSLPSVRSPAKEEGGVSSPASGCPSSPTTFSSSGPTAASFTPPPLASSSGISFTPQKTLAVTRCPHDECQTVRSVVPLLDSAETPSVREEAAAFSCIHVKDDREDVEDSITDEDSLDRRDCGPITQLPHLFPISLSSLKHSPLPPPLVTPSHKSKRGRRLPQAEGKKSGEESATAETIAASSSAPLLSSCPSLPSAVSAASTAPLPFHFTHARLGSWRFAVPPSCCSSQPFMRKDEEKECMDKAAEGVPLENHRPHSTKAVAPSGEKLSPLPKRKRHRNEGAPVESVKEGGERQFDTTTRMPYESASDNGVFSLSFTPVHWVWGMHPTAGQGNTTEVVRCVLPITSIATVLVCPALCGLAVELGAHVKQLPCRVPSSVFDPPEVTQVERDAQWQKQDFLESVGGRERATASSDRTTSLPVSSSHLHRWIVWYFAPEQMAHANPPPEEIEKECSSVPHDRHAMGRKGRKKNTSSSLEAVENETPLHDGGNAQHTITDILLDSTSFFPEWVCSLFRFYHKLGLPEPLCVDSATFSYLIRE